MTYRSDDSLLIEVRSDPNRPRCEIARSFSYKLNMGNYESRDFFCSQKAECYLDEAEAVSERIYAFCKSEVLRAVRQYEDECLANFGPAKVARR